MDKFPDDFNLERVRAAAPAQDAFLKAARKRIYDGVMEAIGRSRAEFCFRLSELGDISARVLISELREKFPGAIMRWENRPDPAHDTWACVWVPVDDRYVRSEQYKIVL